MLAVTIYMYPGCISPYDSLIWQGGVPQILSETQIAMRRKYTGRNSNEKAALR